MRKVIYLFKRIIGLDYKNMFKIAKKISKKTHKNKFLIIIDMIKCGFKYQAGYYDYLEFEFYLLNDKQRSTYLTRGKNNEIIRKYNNKEKAYQFDDKQVFNKMFKQFLGREYINLDNNLEEFKQFLKNKKEIIVKPLDGEGGKGVEKIKVNSDIEKLYQKLINNNQTLVEEVIKQHKQMNKLYDKSVNTLRMFTFVKDGKAYFLQAILKIGNGGVIDNFSSGGMYTFVDNNGVVLAPAIDQDDNYFEKHPLTNEKIVGFKVPLFNEAVELVRKAALIVPDMAYVGWDVALGEDKPILVEGNWFPGVFQMKPSFKENKDGILTLYKKYMDI